MNTVACHPWLPFMATAGVEKLVRVFAWSEFSAESIEDLCDDLRTEVDSGTLLFFRRLVLVTN